VPDGAHAALTGATNTSQELRAAASKPDYTLFPPHRQIPMETAPVKGYSEALRAAAEEVVSSSALGGGKRR
jgi:hypothetical protein